MYAANIANYASMFIYALISDMCLTASVYDSRTIFAYIISEGVFISNMRITQPMSTAFHTTIVEDGDC